MDPVSTRKLEVGQKVTVSRTISDADVTAFAGLSLDSNPVHFDDAYAAKTLYGKKIAHGMISAALISGALTKLMGDSNVLLAMDLEFKKPVYIGDEITCHATIVGIDRRNVASIHVEIGVAESEPAIVGTVRSMRTALSASP